MDSQFEPRRLARFPWATFGRTELPGEFFQKIAEQRSRADLFEPGPRFELTAVLEGERGVSRAADTWESLQLQSYPHWRVRVVGPPRLRETLPADARFEWLEAPEGAAAWQCKNRGLAATATGWFGVLGVGDVLSPCALYQLAWEIERAPEAKGFYSNEAVWDPRRKAVKRFFSKRAWSAETLAHFNYVGRFWIARREALADFENLPAGADEQVALLKLGNCVHVPYFLYYGLRSGEWTEPSEAVCEAVGRATGNRYQIATEEAAGRYRLRLTPVTVERPRVSAIVCFRDKAEMTLLAVKHLVRCSAGVDLDVVLVDNDSSDEELAKIAPFVTALGVPAKLVKFPGAFNFNRMHNWAVREHATAPVLFFLNNDVVLEQVDMASGAAWAARENAATVGMLLRFSHGGVQHAGIRAWFGGEARLARVGNSHARDTLVYENREVFANTFAACFVNRAAFEEVGGLREKDLVNGFGDVAFCLETGRRGRTHFYLGGARATHAEGSSRGKIPYEYWEECGLEREYAAPLQKMLREDLGFDRVPGAEDALLLVQALKQRFRKRSRLLDPIKPWLKKGLLRLLPAKDNL